MDLRAVTIWSLLGAWDWHCLVTRDDGKYETGAFDVRDGTPQPTPLAVLARSLANDEKVRVPPIGLGWWERPDRLLYPPVDRNGEDVALPASRSHRRRGENAA